MTIMDTKEDDEDENEEKHIDGLIDQQYKNKNMKIRLRYNNNNNNSNNTSSTSNNNSSSDNYNLRNIYDFGYCFIKTSDDEGTIIIIGGENNDASILLFNCITNELIVANTQSPIAGNLPKDCTLTTYPSTIVHNDHIHLVSDRYHFRLFLKEIEKQLPKTTDFSRSLN